MFGMTYGTRTSLRVLFIFLIALSLSACIPTDFSKKKDGDSDSEASSSPAQAQTAVTPTPAPATPTPPAPGPVPPAPTPPPATGIGSQAAFVANFYPLLRGNVDAAVSCASCHTNPAIPALIPAITSDNAVAAHDTHFTPVWSKDLVNFADIANSEIVLKVAGGHYCWSGDCAADAATIQQAIEAWDAQK